MKHLFILLLIISSCGDDLEPIKQTVYYNIAIKSLKKSHVEDYTLLEKDELEDKKYIIDGQDTVLLQLGKRLFGFRSKDGKYYIFQFYQNHAFNRFDLNADWQVTSMVVQTGEGVYEDEEKPKAPK